MKILTQTVTLLISFGIVFIWQHTPLSDYTVPALGFLVFVYFIISAKRKNFDIASLGGDGPLGVFILTTLLLLLIFSTGGIYSNLFFLLYFLAFGIAFVFRPAMVFIFVLLAFAIFAEQTFTDDVFNNIWRSGSLILISPLAFFFGREFAKEGDQEKILSENKKTAAEIEEQTTQVLKNESGKLTPEDKTILEDVVQKTKRVKKG